jgi:tryptophan synthase alpha chain
MTNIDTASVATSAGRGIRTADAFVRGKAFIPFVTCGDPDLETTAALVRAMADAGADLIELGIPFSDPTAEGVTIQQANLRSLSGGTTTDQIFELVEQIRPEIDVPLAFMTYANVVYSYGTERFVSRCEEVGMQALILPDVPFEEKGEFDSVCKEHDIDLVSLIAPTSNERIAMIAANASGFVYCVSSLGVTGTRSRITTDIGAMVELVRKSTDLPVAVGFGISNPEQAADMASKSDGAIVGSAIVKIIAKEGRGAVEHVARFVREMAQAVHDTAN